MEEEVSLLARKRFQPTAHFNGLAAPLYSLESLEVCQIKMQPVFTKTKSTQALRPETRLETTDRRSGITEHRSTQFGLITTLSKVMLCSTMSPLEITQHCGFSFNIYFVSTVGNWTYIKTQLF